MKTSRSLGKTLFSLGALLGIGAAPALAFADTDSYVEIQLDAGLMSDIARRQLATMSDFCPQAVEIDGVRGYVDHFDFSDPGEISRASGATRVSINDFTAVEGRAVLYTQRADMHFKTLECAQDPDCSETTIYPAELTYELFTTPASRLCMRSYDARGLPEGVSAPTVAGCLPFDARQALSTAGIEGSAASGAAVSMDGDGTRIALRMEMGRAERDYDEARIREWQRFVDGGIERTGAEGDWSVFTHKSLILGAVEKRVQDALRAQAGFTVDGPVSVTWDGGGSDGRVDVSFDGVFSHTLCPNGIHVRNISLTGRVSPNDAEAPTGLSIDGAVHYDVSASDAAECGLALGGPIGALVFSALSSSIKLDFSTFGPNCRADGDFGFTCDEKTNPTDLAVGPVQIANSGLDHLVATADGLAMNGRTRISGDPFLTGEGRPTSFHYDERAEAYTGALEMSGTGRVCDAAFWADREGDIGLLDIDSPPGYGLPATYGVSLSRANADAYNRNPFELMAMIQTSAGVRTYRFERITP